MKPVVVCGLLAVALSSVLAATGCQPGTPGAPPARDPAPPREQSHTGAQVDPTKRVVYVPAYSHVDVRKGVRTMLGVTLSVRNIDHAATVTLNAVDYFDTGGAQVRSYLDQPVELKPLETAEYFVDVLDDTGGSGANFLIQWSGPPGAHALLTETVMVGHAGQGYLSFTSRGVELEAPPPKP